VTHLIVAGIALLAPVVLKRLQAPATTTPTTTPTAAPAAPTDVTALLPFHGALVNLVLKLLEQQTPQPTK